MPVRRGMDARLEVKKVVNNQDTWIALDVARNVTVTIEDAEADATARGNSGWRVMLQTLRSLTVEVEVVWNLDSEALQELVTAYRDRQVKEVRVLDSAGGSGVQFNAVVTSVRRQEPLEEVVSATLTLKPAPGGVPQWIDGS